MPTPEQLKLQLEALKKQQAELEEQIRIASEPLTVTLTDVLATGLGTKIEIKLSRKDDDIVNQFRFVRSRNYIYQREVNQFDIKDLAQVIYLLKEKNIDLIIPPEQQEKIDKWNAAPDFYVRLDKVDGRIRIDKSIRQSTLGSYYELATWTYHPGSGYWTFSTNELMDWGKIQAGLKFFKFEVSDDVKKLYFEFEEKEKLLNQFADMIDAPEIDFTFKWTDTNGVAHNYDLKPDQRVACKFDDTFGNRTLLSFDMGKGKTAIAIAQAERHNERILFICKADLKTNIKREVKKFTGKEAIIFAGAEPDGLAIDLMLKNKKQYNIINYDIIGREIKGEPDQPGFMKWVELINLSEFDRIDVDEAHYIKNLNTQRSRAVRATKAPKVMLLTGTPIVNRPTEVWPLLNYIDPQNFPDFAIFAKQFTYDGVNPKNLPQLHQLLKKYMIRRLRDKSSDPTRIPQYHTLSSTARKRYNDVLDGLYTALRNPDYQANVTNILTELLRCKQVCADDKVEMTCDLVETALDETVDMPWNKVIVFSQFKSVQADIATRLQPFGARIINGDVTDKNRYDIIDEFQKPDRKVRVIVTNIVEGITLTNAFTVVLNDLMWTPKDISQFEGRAFGRTNDPHGGNSYIVMAEDTIDEMIWSIIEKKMAISKQVIDDVYDPHEAEQSVFKELIQMLRHK